jgi:hypothetical protein
VVQAVVLLVILCGFVIVHRARRSEQVVEVT